MTGAALLWVYLIALFVAAIARLGAALGQHDHDDEQAVAGVIVRMLAPCAR